MSEKLEIYVKVDDSNNSVKGAQDGMKKIEENAKGADQAIKSTQDSTKQMGDKLDNAGMSAANLGKNLLGIAGMLALPTSAMAAFGLLIKEAEADTERLVKGFGHLEEIARINVAIKAGVGAGILPADTAAIVEEQRKKAMGLGVAFEGADVAGAALNIGGAAQIAGVGLPQAMETVMNLYGASGGDTPLPEVARALARAMATGETRALKEMNVYIDPASLEGMSTEEKQKFIYKTVAERTSGKLEAFGKDPTMATILAGQAKEVALAEAQERTAEAAAGQKTEAELFAAAEIAKGRDPTGSARWGVTKEIAKGMAMGWRGRALQWLLSPSQREDTAETISRLTYQLKTPETTINTMFGGANKVGITTYVPENKE